MKVFFKYLPLYRCSSTFYCFQLVENINTIFSLIYHFLDTTDLPFNPLEIFDLIGMTRVLHNLTHSGNDVSKYRGDKKYRYGTIINESGYFPGACANPTQLRINGARRVKRFILDIPRNNYHEQSKKCDVEFVLRKHYQKWKRAYQTCKTRACAQCYKNRRQSAANQR